MDLNLGPKIMGSVCELDIRVKRIRQSIVACLFPYYVIMGKKFCCIYCPLSIMKNCSKKQQNGIFLEET